MDRRSLLFLGLGLVALLSLLNLLAIHFYFYFTLGWYDYMMHFLGGLTLGVLVLWALGLTDKSAKNFLKVFIIVLALGLAWEWFEYIYGITLSTESYGPDTIKDVVMDALGVTAAFLLVTPRSREFLLES